MYLYISVKPEHRDYMRVLWQWPDSEHIEMYRFTCVPFGLAPSAFLAIRCIKWLAQSKKSICSLFRIRSTEKIIYNCL